MKRLFCLLFALLLFPALAFPTSLDASAYIESDGTINLYEWESCDQTILFEGYEISGTCYHSVCVKYRYIEHDNRIYVAVLAENSNSDLSKAPENNYTELFISFDNSSKIKICSDGKFNYNENDFFVKYGSKNDSFGGVSYEAEILLKAAEYNEIITMYVQLKDYEGNLTRIFETDIKSEELKEKESESIAESEKQSEKEAKEKANNEKKKSTTKKETTTELKTEIITEEYVPYSEELKKNNRSVIVIGAVCVLTSVAAMCVSIFKKDKKD